MSGKLLTPTLAVLTQSHISFQVPIPKDDSYRLSHKNSLKKIVSLFLQSVFSSSHSLMYCSISAKSLSPKNSALGLYSTQIKF